MSVWVRIAMIAAGIVLAALPALRAADETAPQPPPEKINPPAGNTP
jgi:hypothetical protein